jgi:outer membrane protein assembly factor BamA
LYQQLEGRYDIISSWGFDWRYYQPLHRCFIFAARVAGATSFGSGKILYYLGGVDNWTTFSSDISKRFDQSIRIDNEENYIYQAVGTNMRGFIQNCRNGNTFAVANAELRLPIFRYLFNRPLSSKLINDFQVVGFFDAGSAWTGFIPGNDNAYNKFDLVDGNIRMIIDVERPSMVAGYGFGLRTSILGYFLRLDWAWGIEGDVVLPRQFYFSLGLDF